MKEQFVTYKPKDKTIAKYISYYYFHKSFENDFKCRFVYYPHFKNTVTIHKDAIAERTKTSGKYISKKGNLEIYYSSNLNLKKEVILEGKFNKIGIVFNTLGLNYFLDCELSKISTELEFDFNYFGKNFENQIDKIYKADDFNEKINLLDAFFAKKHNQNLDKRIIFAVQKIIESKGGITTQEITKLLSISRRTLLRLFKSHLNCSIEEYKKLVRFRIALNYYQDLPDKPKLSDVAYDTSFFDQASFINHFKSIVGKTPKSLFSSLNKLGKEDTYWTFEE